MSIKSKLFATTSRGRRQAAYLVSTVMAEKVYQRLADKASYLRFGRYPKPCHGFETQETLWSILHLRDEVSHLCPEDKILGEINVEQFDSESPAMSTTRCS